MFWAISLEILLFVVIVFFFQLKIHKIQAQIKAGARLSDQSTKSLAELRALTNALTERDELIKSKDRALSAVMDLATGGWWLFNVQTKEDYLSQGWLQLLGYKPCDLANHMNTWLEVMHPDDRDLALSRLNEHIESNGRIPYSVVARYKHRDGYYIRLRDEGKIFEWDDNGKPLKMVGFETYLGRVDDATG